LVLNTRGIPIRSINGTDRAKELWVMEI